MTIGPITVMLPRTEANAGTSPPMRETAPIPVIPTESATPVILFIMEVVAAIGNLRGGKRNVTSNVSILKRCQNRDETFINSDTIDLYIVMCGETGLPSFACLSV